MHPQQPCPRMPAEVPGQVCISMCCGSIMREVLEHFIFVVLLACLLYLVKWVRFSNVFSCTSAKFCPGLSSSQWDSRQVKKVLHLLVFVFLLVIICVSKDIALIPSQSPNAILRINFYQWIHWVKEHIHLEASESCVQMDLVPVYAPTSTL